MKWNLHLELGGVVRGIRFDKARPETCISGWSGPRGRVRESRYILVAWDAVKRVAWYELEDVEMCAPDGEVLLVSWNHYEPRPHFSTLDTIEAIICS